MLPSQAQALGHMSSSLLYQLMLMLVHKQNDRCSNYPIQSMSPLESLFSNTDGLSYQPVDLV